MSPYLNTPPTTTTTNTPRNHQPPPAPSPPPTTLHLPRILCLHGGGVNAEVFTLQCRALISRLSTTFRLVFADGPHYCGPGPDIVPVYEDYGPFRRWLRWKPGEHAEIDNESATEEILYCVRRAMEEDAGDGEWVGLLGFSQGAKVAASLLYDVQMRRRKGATNEFGWRFAVIMQGRHPIVAMSEYSRHPACVNAGEISEGFNYEGEFDAKLELPTVHVHGLQDGGLLLHRKMMREYCEPRSVTLVEWEGGHRLPIKTNDVDKVCQAIWKVARQQGVEC